MHAFADEFSEHVVNGVVVGISHSGPATQVVRDLQTPASRTRLKHVEWLSLQQHVIEPAEIHALSVLPKLRRIEIGYFPDEVVLSQGVFPALSKINTLRELEIYGSFSDNNGGRGFIAIPQLQVLAISPGIALDALPTISAHQNLKSLQLATEHSIEEFEWLKKLKTLETLELDAKHLDGSVVLAVKSLHHLTELSLGGLQLDRSHVRELAGGNSLQSVDFTVTSNVGLEDLATLKELRHLAVVFEGEPTTDLTSLLSVPSLRSLRMHGWIGDRADAVKLLDQHPTLSEISVFDGNGRGFLYRVSSDQQKLQ